LTENIYVNCLSAEGAPFIDFKVVARSATILPPVEDNMKNMYMLLSWFAFKGIADAEFRRNTIFVKGDDYKVAEQLNESKIAFVGEKREVTTLKLNNDLSVMRVLFYRALSRYAMKKGFRPPLGKKRSKWMKLLPLGINLEELIKQELAIKMNDDLAVYRGLYVMLEIFNDGEAILWVDLYSPIVKLSEQRPLSPKEAKSLGLRDIYTSFIPAPKKRFELTNKLLKILCSDSKLNVVFADGSSASFTYAFPILKVT